MMGSSVLSQILHYLMVNGPNLVSVFNGLSPGQGDRSTTEMKLIDVSAPAIQHGAAYLDNSSGLSYQFSTKKGVWVRHFDLGHIKNGSRASPPRR